jgi:hypothetical protein
MSFPALASLAGFLFPPHGQAPDARVRWFFWSLAAIGIFVVTFAVPGSAGIYGTNLDDSYSLVIEDAARRGMVFGRELIYTHGPLGYLFQPAGLGGFEGQRLFYGILRAAFSAYVCCAVLSAVAMPLRVVVLLWLLTHSPSPTVIFAGVAVRLLLPPESRWLRRLDLYLLPAVCGLSGIVKFTEMISGFMVVGCVGLVYAYRREWGRAWKPAAVFLASTMVTWLLAGQPLAALPDYFSTSWSIASGFEVMVIVPKPGVLVCGLIGAAVLIVGACAVCATSPKRIETALRLLPVLASAFLDWKHGFVRADNHVLNFFGPLAFYAAMLFAGASRRVWWHECVVLAALVSGIAGMRAGGFKLAEVVWVVGKWAGTGAPHEISEAKQQAVREDAALPRIAAAVGHATVDIFNYRQAFAYLNGLSLRPRPVFQSYHAYTPSLQAINLEHYLSPRRPALVMFRIESTDGRWSWLDDAPLALHLITEWEPIAREKGFTLLQPAARSPSGQWRDLGTGSARWEETVPVPPHPPGSLVALSLEGVRRTPWGRAKRFLYQGANLRLFFKTDGGWSAGFNFIPEMATTGVLLSPLLETPDDLIGWQTGTVVPRHPRGFALLPWTGHENEFEQGYRYRFSLWTPGPSRTGAGLEKRAPDLLFPYLPAQPLTIDPHLDIEFAGPAEIGSHRLPARIEIPVPPGVSGIEGQAFIVRKKEAVDEVSLRIQVKAGDGRVIQHGHSRPGPRMVERIQVDIDFDRATLADAQRRLFLEASAGPGVATGDSVKGAWGPLKWKQAGDVLPR